MAEPEADRRDIDEAKEAFGGLVLAGGDMPIEAAKLPKRLDLARDAARAHETLPGLIVANWAEDRLR